MVLFFLNIVLESLIFKAGKNFVKLVVKYLGPEAECIPSNYVHCHLSATSGAHRVFARVGVVNSLRDLLLVVENDSLVLLS